MASIEGNDTEEQSQSSGSWICVNDDEFDALSINFKPKPVEKYPAKLHARSVAKRLGTKAGLIYLVGLPSKLYEDSDMPVIFRQRRYFYYLTGIDLPDCTVTYNIQRDQLRLWIPAERTGRDVIYNGFTPSPDDIYAKYDFDHVGRHGSLDGYIAHFAHRESGDIFVLHEDQKPKLPERSNGANVWSYIDHFDTSRLQPAMDASRAIKSAYEIKLIRKASEISAQAHTNVLLSIKYLENESEVEAVFQATSIAARAKHQAYGVIAAAGENASTLHYMANNEPLKGRQLLCLDAGCEWKCYASDVTRTFPISGKHTTESKAIYDLVAKMQEECIKMVKPNANYRDIHLHAHKVAIRGLMELGLLNGSFEELYAAGASVMFLPHGLGHYMGLEVHDVGAVGNLLYAFQDEHKDWMSAYHEIRSQPSTSASSILAPNMVITVEPGIYFSRYALEDVYLKDPKYAKFINKDFLQYYYPVGGVRIEDDILVTEDGFENLTTAPKGQAALDIINGYDENATVAMKAKSRGWSW
ncbi:Aminoacylproline aminopeptidase [Hyphodiscus hymeniophilus]|uniref:Xaa-Pro aminopeptidase n=1 Tax=Hyphodiscus hymeniophilus TaxID=353542 RepID=A0A9P6VFH9_9HELO|nr:Aminoacylproline aminopeptidase [Hyphodiscus hymeniophilus]